MHAILITIFFLFPLNPSFVCCGLPLEAYFSIAIRHALDNDIIQIQTVLSSQLLKSGVFAFTQEVICLTYTVQVSEK